VFFWLPTWALTLLVFGVVFLACVIGGVLGGLHSDRKERLREPLGIVQGAILGVVGLVLAFGLTLAIDRYENRRAAVVDDANAISTTYLRSQTLREPERTQSIALALLTLYLEMLGRGRVPIGLAAGSSAPFCS
jgi:MFS family permease